MQVDDDKLRAMWKRGDTCAAIGEALGCSKQAASSRAHELGLPRRAIAQGSLPVAWIVARYMDGRTADEITADLRPRFPTLSRSTVTRTLLQRGVEMRPAVPRPRVDPVECVRLVRRGIARKEIARMFGVGAWVVNHALAKILGRLRHGGHKGAIYDYQRIRQLAAEGHSQRAIAKIVGCSRPTVGKALSQGAA